MFSLNGTLQKSGSVGRWETKQFIGMALLRHCTLLEPVDYSFNTQLILQITNV